MNATNDIEEINGIESARAIADGFKAATEADAQAEAERVKAKRRDEAQPLIELGQRAVKSWRRKSAPRAALLIEANALDVEAMAVAGSAAFTWSFKRARAELATLLDPRRLEEIKNVMRRVHNEPDSLTLADKDFLRGSSGIGDAIDAAANQLTDALEKFRQTAKYGRRGSIVAYAAPVADSTAVRGTGAVKTAYPILGSREK